MGATSQAEAEQLLVQAERLLNRGQTREAESEFASAELLVQSAIVEAREQRGPLLGLGKCYQQLARIYAATGREREAVAAFQRSRHLDPTNNWVHARFADLLLASDDPEIYDPVRARELAARSVTLTKGDEVYLPVMLATYGRACFESGDYAAATVALQQSAEGDTSGLRATIVRYLLAISHWRLGHEQESRRWHQRAEESGKLSPKNMEIRRLRRESKSCWAFKAQTVRPDESQRLHRAGFAAPRLPLTTSIDGGGRRAIRLSFNKAAERNGRSGRSVSPPQSLPTNHNADRTLTQDYEPC